MTNLVSKEKNKVVFKETVSYEDFKNSVQEAYLKNKGRFNIPGFRKGKAPRKIIENNYGKEVFWNDAIDLMLPELYKSAIENLDLEPVSRPKIDVFEEIKEGEDFDITFEVEVYPEFELADYSNIEVEKMDEEIDESLVDAKIQEQLEENKILKPTEKEVEIGNIVNIDFEGFKDGVPFEGGKSEGHELKIGSKQFIPGFEEGLIGKKQGEEIDLNINFPEDYHVEELKGAPVVFKVKINEVLEEIYPELDDDFVMDVSEYDTLDEYKASIRKDLEEKKKASNEIELENKVLEEVLKRTEIDIPSQMIEDQLEDEYQDYVHQISQLGMNIETYITLTGQSEESIRDSLREGAENKVKVQVILDEMVEDRQYEVSEEELEAEYDDVLKQYGREGDEEFKKLLKSQVDENQVKLVLQRRKALDELKSNAVFVEKKENEEAEEVTEEDK